MTGVVEALREECAGDEWCEGGRAGGAVRDVMLGVDGEAKRSASFLGQRDCQKRREEGRGGGRGC
eukprot:751994-Hanusia_phi.AAC.3